MNVMIYNKYKDLLKKLDIDVMKSMEGVYNVDEIIDTFSNFYYDKMILDITSIRDYQNIDNLQKLAMNINMDNVILLLDNNPESETPTYISKLISLGIYNFTRNSNGINYLLVHPHSYKDVASMHDIDEVDKSMSNSVELKVNEEPKINEEPKVNEEPVHKNMFIPVEEPKIEAKENNVTNAGIKIIGFKNVTNHAGATTLIYMLKKSLSLRKKVAGIEVNKVDFLFFNDKDLVSTTTVDLPKEIMQRMNYDCLLIDLNDYQDLSICNEVYYLIEPSTIMINKMMKKNKNILEELRDKNIILNKSVLSDNDISTFEYETKLKVLYSVPPCDDRQNRIEEIEKLVNKLHL